jgi:hypothetical protein
MRNALRTASGESTIPTTAPAFNVGIMVLRLVLALVSVVRDMILSTLSSSGTSVGKRRRNLVGQSAALSAITNSCVEELPESYVYEFVDAVAALPPSTGVDQAMFASACIALVSVCDTDGIKRFVKLLMQQTVQANSDIQQLILSTMCTLWKKIGDPMVPSITEITLYLNELYGSRDSCVREAARSLVREMDRRTGENIGEKLGGQDDEMSNDEMTDDE